VAQDVIIRRSTANDDGIEARRSSKAARSSSRCAIASSAAWRSRRCATVHGEVLVEANREIDEERASDIQDAASSG